MTDLLLKFAAEATGQSVDKIKEAIIEGENFKEDAKSTLSLMFKEKMEAITSEHKEALTDKFNDGFKKAQGKGLSDFAEQVKKEMKEKYDFVPTKADLSDAIGEYAEYIKNKALQNNEPTEDAIIKSKPYVDLQNALQTKYKPIEDYEKVTSEFEQYKKGLEIEKVHSQVFKKALSLIEEKGVVWGENDPDKKKEFFKKELLSQASQFEIDETGNILLKDEDGRFLKDSAGNVKKFEDAAIESASWLSFNKQPPKGSPQGGNSGGAGYSGSVPKNDQEYAEATKGLNGKELVDLTAAYEASQG